MDGANPSFYTNATYWATRPVENISFNASEKKGSKVKIDKAYVTKWYKSAKENEKLANYII